MATYTGLDKRLAYLFANGGGGGSCKVISGYYHDGDFYEDQSYTQIITGDTECLYIDLDTTTLYLFDGTDYVEVQGGGGGAFSDGTVGVRIAVNIPASGSVTYSFDDLGITEYGSYWFLVNSKHAESLDGWKWVGFIQYSGYYTSSYVTSYAKALDSHYVTVAVNEQAETVTITNNNSNWNVDHLIEVLPLHPKIEIPKHTYSTTEQVVGTWIDGKPIYEKTISWNNTRIEATSYVHGISDLERCINSEAFLDDSDNDRTFILPFYGNDGILLVREVNQTYVILGGTNYFNASANRTFYVTLRYTKSTT